MKLFFNSWMWILNLDCTSAGHRGRKFEVEVEVDGNLVRADSVTEDDSAQAQDTQESTVFHFTTKIFINHISKGKSPHQACARAWTWTGSW